MNGKIPIIDRLICFELRIQQNVKAFKYHQAEAQYLSLLSLLSSLNIYRISIISNYGRSETDLKFVVNYNWGILNFVVRQTITTRKMDGKSKKLQIAPLCVCDFFLTSFYFISFCGSIFFFIRHSTMDSGCRELIPKLKQFEEFKRER